MRDRIDRIDRIDRVLAVRARKDDVLAGRRPPAAPPNFSLLNDQTDSLGISSRLPRLPQ